MDNANSPTSDSSSSSSASSDDDIEILLALLLLRRRMMKKRRRRFHVNYLWLSREERGAHNFVQETALFDEVIFKKYTRMTVGQYEELLQLVGSGLLSAPTRKDIITPSTKLMLTLRFLATGESLSSLHMQYRMGLSTALKWAYITMRVLYDRLQPIVMRMPQTPEEWEKISDGFERLWQFPHVWGAIDGKHVVMQAQPNSGSTFFNYKGRHSIILLAVCDAEYRFIAVDVGARGRESDGGVLKKSNLGKKIAAKSLNLPPPSEICHGGPILPYFCLADAAFPLHENIMRPYPGRSTGRMPMDQRIFNYRLSRGRRTIENSFGIMGSQWRIYRTAIHASEEHLKLIVLATTVLHNYLRKKEEDLPDDRRHYCPTNFCDRTDENGVEIPGEWRRDCQLDAFLPLPGVHTQNLSALNIQRSLMNYFLNQGSVPWQIDRVNAGAF